MNTDKIHVVHIIPSLGFGGAERCVVDIINHSSEEFRYSIIVFFDKIPLAKEITKKDVTIKVVSKKGKLSLHLIRDIREVLLELQPDVVHTHIFGADMWGRIAAKTLGLPVITTEHNINEVPGEMRKKIKKWFKNWSDQYAACSKAVKKYVVKRYNPEPPIEVVPCGIDFKRFASLKPLSSTPGIIRILILGRLTVQKGHRYALEALAQLKEFNWMCDVVGDGELSASLKKQTEVLGISERVQFMPPTHDVPALLETHEMLLVPSLWEGLGIVVMEAMAAGRVVLGSRVDGIPEMIEDRKTGFLAMPGETQDWAANLEWNFTHFKEATEVAAAAREYAQNHFGVEKMVMQYEQLYRKILS